MRALIASILLLIATQSFAQERVLDEQFVGMGGMICDTVDEVKSALSGEDPEGCGVLTRPMVMRVTVLETYEDKYIVRYDFLNAKNLPPQYGVAPLEKKGVEA